jgi:hypothetical protein
VRTDKLHEIGLIGDYLPILRIEYLRRPALTWDRHSPVLLEWEEGPNFYVVSYSSIGPVPFLFSSWFSTVRGSLNNISLGTVPFIFGSTAQLGPVPDLSLKNHKYHGF